MDKATLVAKIVSDHVFLEELLENQEIKPMAEGKIRHHLAATLVMFAELFPAPRHVAPSSASDTITVPRCPTCDSPQPGKHPAVQHGGEVQLCSDRWHSKLSLGQPTPADGPDEP